MISRIGTFLTFLFFIFMSTVSFSFAEVYSFSKDNTVIGFFKTYTVQDDESLIEIARNFDLGYNEIVGANPGLDPFIPGTGVSVKLPTSWVLPDVALCNGIVINLSEMRLYYLFRQKGSSLVRTFPIGIGIEGNDTPIGKFKVIEKLIKPSWHVPESIKKEKPELPRVVPPGPNNPLGSHALRLSLSSILIHGTNKPWGVGRKVSHGCIRLYPEDIPKLFQLVSYGAKVVIVRQPIKVGIKNSKVYVEVHKDDSMSMSYFNEAVNLLIKKNLIKRVNNEKLYYAISEKSGIPVEISN